MCGKTAQLDKGAAPPLYPPFFIGEAMQETKKKHGSEKRERNKLIAWRVNDGEHAELTAKAERAGLSVAGYLRVSVFGKETPQPRAARRPPLEKAELVALRYELRKIGGNLNQIAHAVNAAQGFNALEYQHLCTQHLAVLTAILKALGGQASTE